MHFEKCPYCKTEVFKHPKTKYCHNCSKIVLPDKCANADCDAYKEQLLLPPGSKYCPLCRRETTNKAHLESNLPF